MEDRLLHKLRKINAQIEERNQVCNQNFESLHQSVAQLTQTAEQLLAAMMSPATIAEANTLNRAYNNKATDEDLLQLILNEDGLAFPGFPMTKLDIADMKSADLQQALNFYGQQVPALKRDRYQSILI